MDESCFYPDTMHQHRIVSLKFTKKVELKCSHLKTHGHMRSDECVEHIDGDILS